MSPIPAIAPIDSALRLGAHGAAPAPQAVANHELSAKFEALMQRHAAETAADGSQGVNALAGVIERQQSEITHMQTSMQDFIEKAPSLDPMDRFVAHATIMQQESLVHMKMSLALGVTKSSNKSLQSLLKNE